MDDFQYRKYDRRTRAAVDRTETGVARVVTVSRRDALSAGTRRAQLAALVAERGFLRVADAASEFALSEVTIRSDFGALEAAGDVVRTHGGAVPGPSLGAEPTLEEAQARDSASKRAIGERAARLVSSGESVLLDVGSTALAVANALVRRDDLEHVTVITNGLSIALALEPALPRISVVMTGGTLRPLQHSLVNPGVSEFLTSVHTDLAFIGCNGVDLVRGVTNINFPEAEVKRRMMQSSARRILIADSGKLGSVHLGVIGPLSDFDVFVTDRTAAEVDVSPIRDRGVEVLLADSGRG